VAAQLPGLGPVAWTLGYYAKYADALRLAARELGGDVDAPCCWSGRSGRTSAAKAGIA
jgi:hypothetical protein